MSSSSVMVVAVCVSADPATLPPQRSEVAPSTRFPLSHPVCWTLSWSLAYGLLPSPVLVPVPTMSEESPAPTPARPPISVFVRCRPLNSRESQSPGESEYCVTMNGDRVIVSDATRAEKLDQKFAGCFWSVDGGDGQNVVYDVVGAPLVAQALKGFDATLFAYGVTGAGKSHSMHGYESTGQGYQGPPGTILRLRGHWAACACARRISEFSSLIQHPGWGSQGLPASDGGALSGETCGCRD